MGAPTCAVCWPRRRRAFTACRPVLDFTPQGICLDMGDTLVTLYGEELRIESFAGKRLILAGRFARVELRSKWEVTQP